MRESGSSSSRRSFLLLLAGAFSLPGASTAGAGTERTHACGHHSVAAGGRRAVPHPDPRPGIDGSLVLTREQLGAMPESVKAVYEMVREIPQIADGLGCNCGCSALPSYRSLLTCFYENRMAVGCNICQGEAKLAYRRHKEGQSLAQIRRAIDTRFG